MSYMELHYLEPVLETPTIRGGFLGDLLDLGALPASKEIKVRLTKDAKALKARPSRAAYALLRDELEAYEPWADSSWWSGYESYRDLNAKLRKSHEEILYQEGRSVRPEAPKSLVWETTREVGTVLARAPQIASGEAARRVALAAQASSDWLKKQKEEIAEQAKKTALAVAVLGLLGLGIYGYTRGRGERTNPRRKHR